MPTMDRRSGSERRSTQRFKVTIDVDWETSSGRQIGTLGDISEMGCFVLGGGEIQDGETVKIFLPLGDGMKIQFLAEVTNHVFEIGFAARFVGLSRAQRDFLNKFVAAHQEY